MNDHYLHELEGMRRFCGQIIRIIGTQTQRAKCWQNRSKFEQNMLN